MQKDKKLLLVDAFAIIYRAYFAFIKNPRINSNGLNTSAIFGFVNSLLEVMASQKPTHLAVVFDTKEPTERHLVFPEYKAHRDAMPEGISEAIPYIHQFLEAMQIRQIAKSGFEADDIIGTLAKKAEKEGFRVLMMTPDKDFAQLVSDNIRIYRPGNKFQPTTILGIQEVLDKFQIKKIEQVIDFLGMMGDSADNIPGIPGIGEKTAQLLLNQYGSLEEVLEHSNELTGKLKEKVQSGKEIGLLSKKLVTITTDVPLELTLEELSTKPKNEPALRVLFETLEFNTLLTRVLSVSNIPPQEKREKELVVGTKSTGQMDLFATTTSEKTTINYSAEYQIINDFEKAKSLLSTLANHQKIAIEIHIEGDDPFSTNINGIALCLNKNKSYFFSFKESDLLSLFHTFFENKQLLLIGNNLKEQIKPLFRKGITINAKLFDIRVAHYLLQPDLKHDLEVLAESYLQTNLSSTINKSYLGDYFNQRADVILQLYHILQEEMKQKSVLSLFETIEMPLLVVLSKMEIEGIRMNTDILVDYASHLEKELEQLSQEIFLLSGTMFNIASPKQLGEILFDKLQISKKVKKTKSGQYSTSEETLHLLKDTHAVIPVLLEYRELTKLLSTYVIALPKLVNKHTNRIHTTFNQTVASTGRLSSVQPNLQNIPIRTEKGKKIREAFVPANNHFLLLSADYSQIELRIMASVSGDESMIKAFHSGVDIHAATAAKVYKVPLDQVDKTMRSNAKAVNFGIIYGISAFGLSQNIGISRTQAKEIIEEYFIQFPQVKDYMHTAIQKAREVEFAETIFGRKRYLPDINSRNAVQRAMAERNAINAPIQGSAADIIKKAMIDIQIAIEQQKLKSKMILQVHDELVFDMHIDEKLLLPKLVKEKMEEAVPLKVPLIVEIGIGENWLQSH